MTSELKPIPANPQQKEIEVMRKYMDALEFNQSQLAEWLNTTRQAVNNWLSAINQPSTDWLLTLMSELPKGDPRYRMAQEILEARFKVVFGRISEVVKQ